MENKNLKSFIDDFDGDVVTEIPLSNNKNNRVYSDNLVEKAMSNPSITKFENDDVTHEKPDINLDALEKFVRETLGLSFQPYERTERPVDNNGSEFCNLLNELIVNHKIPESIPNYVSELGGIDIENHHLIFEYRDRFIQYGGFSLVAYDWVRLLKETIIKDSKCLEIMSGSGMLAKALKDVGCDVIATDNKTWGKDKRSRRVDWFENPFTEIEEIDCIDAIDKYGKEVDFVIVSWAYMDDTCYRALLKMREVNPNCIMIYIGEYGDCCADENFTEAAVDFYDSLYEYQNNQLDKIVDNLEEMCESLDKIRELYRNWWGIHDDIYLVK